MSNRYRYRYRYIVSFLVGVLLLPLLWLRAEYYAKATLSVVGKSDQSGPVQLSIQLDNGRGFSSFNKLVHSLEVQAGEVFAIERELPYQKITAFRVTGNDTIVLSELRLESAGKSQALLAETQSLKAPVVSEQVRIDRIIRPPLLLMAQILASMFIAYLCYLVFPLFSVSGRTSFLHWFSNQQGWALVGMVGVSAIAHSLWLVGLWPAQMTNDSWATLADQAALRLTNWHPYVYTMFALISQQLIPGVESMVLAQIISTSVLVSSLFYYCLRSGVSQFLVLPFFLLFTCSIPIGLMNTMIWKDVPFSIAVLGVSGVLFVAAHLKQCRNQYLRIPLKFLPLVVIGIISVCHMRHNGLIFYGCLPVLFFSSLRRRDFAALCAILVVAYCSLNILIPRALGIQMTKGSPYHEVRTALAIMTHPNYYSEDRQRDYEIVSEYVGMEWQEIERLFATNWWVINDRGVARHQYKADLGYSASGFNRAFLTRLILQNLPIFLSARTFDFFHSLAIDTSKSDERNNYYYNPMQLTGSNLGPPGNMVFNHALESQRPWQRLSEQVAQLEQWSKTYDGVTSPQVLIWNLLIPLGLFVGLFFIEKAWSPIVLFMLPSTLVSGGIFILGAGESWRYFYCVYLCSIPLIPLYCAQLIGQRRQRRVIEQFDGESVAQPQLSAFPQVVNM